MAVIAQTVVTGVSTPVIVTKTVLSSSDTLVYASGTNQTFEITNGTAGTLPLLITGSTATNVSPSGLGAPVVVSGGFTISLAAGQTKVINLDKIAAYLSGTITCTGAALCTASITV